MAGGKRIGAGRKKGIPNTINGQLKDMILKAMDRAGGKEGGIAYLTQQAKEHPVAFLGLLGKVLPMTITGDPDKPLEILIKRYDPDNAAE